MPYASYNLDIPANTWTEVAAGPTGILFSANDNYQYAYSTGTPAGILGHYGQGLTDQVMRPLAGQSLWVFNPLRPFRATVALEGSE